MANLDDVRVRIADSIISQNFSDTAKTTPNNLVGRLDIANTNYNLVGSGSTILDLSGGSSQLNFTNLNYTSLALNDSPLLGPLVYNGGPTPTHALLPSSPAGPGSPAINAGDPLIMPSMTEFDQRGAPWNRVAGLHIDIGAVEWQANPLRGDYNFDGTVNAADFTVWRNTLHSTTDLRADGDGNGKIEENDYRDWKMYFGAVMGDASGNGAVDFADYIIWESTYGSTTDLRADCNEDGIVDDADFDIWFDTFGSTMEIAAFGMLSSFFDPDAPPAVVGVALGLPGVQALGFAGKVGSGEQIRSVPLIAANTLNITFNRDVNVSYSDLQLVNLDGSSPTIFDFSYDSLAQTATWTFTTSLANGRYLIRLSDSIESLDGKALDGEFFNPISLSDAGSATFPSGDGDAGGEFRFRFTVLSGDTDHDNVDGATNYTNWQSTEPGMIIVSTTADDWDANLAFGDVSLREAVNYANTAGTPTSIQLPAGRYTLSRTGSESTATVALNDLDILGDVTILGAGPGLSIIDNSGLVSAPANHAHAFALDGAARRLRLSGMTVANGASTQSGQVAVAANGATFEILDSAIVNHTAYASGSAILISSAHLVVSRSVFTNNDNTSILGGTAIWLTGTTAAPASVEVGESIFALNAQPTYNGGTTHYAIRLSGTVTKINHGKNLYDYAGGGFFDTTPGVDDYLGTPNYVVTSAADTFNHADDLEALSLREAIDLANNATAPAEVWLPAWRFTLTLDRGANASDTDVAFGDLDVKNSVTIRGVQGRTSVAWMAGVVDKVFDLLGDYNNDGEADYGSVSAADYTIWQNQNGSSGGLEQFSADGDDDGDVDAADYDIWHDNYGHALDLVDVGV
jgi:hypothetical protein